MNVNSYAPHLLKTRKLIYQMGFLKTVTGVLT
jgi:hypothetical protein